MMTKRDDMKKLLLHKNLIKAVTYCYWICKFMQVNSNRLKVVSILSE